MICNVLSIAGTDPSGGAGSPADVKTFSALGVYGAAVVTAVVAQSTRGVVGIHPVPAAFVGVQLDAVFDDLRIDAVKIGMLGTAEVVRVVADVLRRRRPRHVVLDPVMVATSGDPLLDAGALTTLREELLPLVDLITPNTVEAAALLGEPEAVTLDQAADQVARLNRLCPGVLLTGGHLDGPRCVDLLAIDGATTRWAADRVDTMNTHGTGCTLSSAVTALRPQRAGWALAVRDAKEYLTAALRVGDLLDVGQGRGPVHHFHALWPPAASGNGLA